MPIKLEKSKVKNQFFLKILNNSYIPSLDFFEIDQDTYITNAGVIFNVKNYSFGMDFVSDNKFSILFDVTTLQLIGYGTWFYEIKAVFPNSHKSTLITGSFKITPIA